MAKRPENRWSSAADLAEALRAELAALPRQQLRVSAEQWAARGRTLLLDPAALSRDKSAVGLSEVEASLLVATRRYLQRATWLCRILVAALHAGRAGRVFHVAFARQESPALGSGL